MIDLESLVRLRAEALSQSETEWIDVVRTDFVEAACTSLSDGEIEQIIACSSSPAVLGSLFEAIAKASNDGEELAFKKWKAAVTGHGLDLNEGADRWQARWAKEADFEKCMKAFLGGKKAESRPKLKVVRSERGRR